MFDEFSCGDVCIPCVVVFVNLDVIIVYGGEKLLFEYGVYSVVKFESTYSIVEGTVCLRNMRAGRFLGESRGRWWSCRRRAIDVAQDLGLVVGSTDGED